MKTTDRELSVFVDESGSFDSPLDPSRFNEAFKTLPTVFVPCVKPERYRLFQVADLICTIELLKLKIKANIPLTKSELLFFRNHGILKRTYIRPLSRLMW